MNRNALTEQRRETVIGLLKGMNIKKSTVGGFDKEDVYDCMQQLCDLYEKNIEELEHAYEGEINALKERYQKYDDNNELYVSLIMEAKKSSNDIITQAKNEVETILAEGREEVAKQEKELEQMRVGADTEKKAMTDELNAAREAVEAEKAAMKAEVDAEREKVTALKNKYSQQLNSMETEFEEIRINVLRIAGKIDSLKSKLPNDDEVNWTMASDLDTVGFPASEVEVENTITPVHVEELKWEPVIEDEPVILAAEPAAPAVEPEITATEPVSPVIEPVVAAAEPIMPIIEEAVKEKAQEEASAEDEIPALTLEDLTAPEEIIADVIPTDEISFEGIEIELPELKEEPADVIPTEVKTEETSAPLDEISFEGLEDLFKDDK